MARLMNYLSLFVIAWLLSFVHSATRSWSQVNRVLCLLIFSTVPPTYSLTNTSTPTTSGVVPLTTGASGNQILDLFLAGCGLDPSAGQDVLAKIAQIYSAFVPTYIELLRPDNTLEKTTAAFNKLVGDLSGVCPNAADVLIGVAYLLQAPAECFGQYTSGLNAFRATNPTDPYVFTVRNLSLSSHTRNWRLTSFQAKPPCCLDCFVYAFADVVYFSSPPEDPAESTLVDESGYTLCVQPFCCKP